LFRDAYVDVDFYLGREVLFHFLLDPTKHEWPQDLVELVHNLPIPLLLFLVTHLFSILPPAQVEPLIKVFRGRENIWQQEIQQTPQLMEVVLERSACEEESVPRVEGP